MPSGSTRGHATIDNRRFQADLAVPGNLLHVMPGLRPGHPRLRRGAKTWMHSNSALPSCVLNQDPSRKHPAWGTKPGQDETCDATLEHKLWRKALQHLSLATIDDPAASRPTSPCPVNPLHVMPGSHPEEPRSCAASRRMATIPYFAALLRDASASPMLPGDEVQGCRT